MTSECVRWPGAHRKSDGRPVTNHGAGPRYAYRELWEATYGALEPEILLHHTCENAWCVNLEHLEPITRSRHAVEHAKGGDWGQADKTHCPAGHPYDESNTYVYTRKDGRTERHCRECGRVKKRQRRRDG